MNHRNRQQSIIKSGRIIGVSVIVCVGLAIGGSYFIESIDYTRAGIMGLLIGLIVGLILSVIVQRNDSQKRHAISEDSLYEPRFEVYKRDYMVSRLEEEITRAKIQGLNLAIAFVELVYSENQHMKDPDTSSKLVHKAIKQIQAQLPNAHILGYDEGNTFIVIMPEATEQQAILLAQDMYASITEKPVVIEDNISTDFKIIVGIVENNNGIQDTESALQLARRALLSAWGARYDSIGYVSGFRTASINTVQVEIVAFGAIGEFAVASETVVQQMDETLHVRPQEFIESDLNIDSDDDTLSFSPSLTSANNKMSEINNDVVTQPISPFILDSLSDDYLAAVEEQNLADIETPTSNSFDLDEVLASEGDEESDDLSRIEGIGPKYEEILNSAGIISFAQIAVMSEDEIVELIQSHGGRKSASMSTWAAQAKLAADKDWDGLEKFQQETS